MGEQDKIRANSHRMKICVGKTSYLIESCPLDAADEHRLYAYRVWCDGVLVKDWTEGNMADFFATLPAAGME